MSAFEWKYGEKARIADLCEIAVTDVYQILSRKRGVGKQRAKELENASEQVLGYPIPFEAWLFNDTTNHPAFAVLEGL